MNEEIKNSGNIPQGGQQIIINQTESKSNGVGTAGFVLALIAMCFVWAPFFGFVIGGILWLLGLVLSFAGVFKKPRGLAIAGLVISLSWITLKVLVFSALLAGTAALGSSLVQATKEQTKPVVENTVQSNSVSAQPVKQESKFFEENLYESPKNEGETGRISKNHPIAKLPTITDDYIEREINAGRLTFGEESDDCVHWENSTIQIAVCIEGYYDGYSVWCKKDGVHFGNGKFYDKEDNVLVLE